MSQLFASDTQNTGVSSLASVFPLTSLKTDWSDLLAAQGALRSLLQHHSLKAVIHSLYGSALITIRDHWEDTALTIQSSVSRVTSLLFNTVRFVIAFLSRNKCLLMSWLQSPSAVILEPKKRQSVTASTFSPSTCHAVMGLDAMTLVL